MRNFSNVTTHQAVFSYYSVNQEYYHIPDIEEIRNRLLKALALAFETPASEVRKEFDFIYESLVPRSTGMLDSNYQEMWVAKYLPTSEGRVLADLINWYHTCMAANDEDASTFVFNYCNLNTGRSLTAVYLIS